MKLSTKKFGSIATAAVLAGTMAFMPATALAAQVTSPAIGLTKYWEVPSEAQNTDETFNFTLKYNDNETQPVGSNGIADPTSNSAPFKSKTVSVSKSDFSGGTGTKTATKTFAEIFGDIEFSKPGYYYFTLTENLGTNQNIVYDTSSYKVQVEVTWATDNGESNGAPTSETRIASVWAYKDGTKRRTALPSETLIPTAT